MFSNEPIDIKSKRKVDSKTFKKATGFFKLFLILDDYIQFLNKNTLFVGMMMFVMNITSRFVNIKVSKSMEGYLKYTFSKNILIFTIAFIGTRDLYAALGITFLFYVSMDLLLNEDSAFCCLPESFTTHHIALVDNSGNLLNDVAKGSEQAPGLGTSVQRFGQGEESSSSTSEMQEEDQNLLMPTFKERFVSNPVLESMTPDEQVKVEEYLNHIRNGKVYLIPYQ